MNLLQTLVYNLPESVQKKALDAGAKSDDCCTVNCASIEVIEDYIAELLSAIKVANKIIEGNTIYGKLEVCDGRLCELTTALNGKG